MLQKKDMVFFALKKYIGEYAPVADAVQLFLKHKDIVARELTADEKQEVRTKGLSVLVFREQRKDFKKFSPEKKKDDTTFIFEPRPRIYGFSNDFKRCTFMSIGKPNDEMVMNQLNLFHKNYIPKKVYYAWISPSEITEEMLNSLCTRNLDGVIIYDKQVEAKQIKRIDKVSMEKTKFFAKYLKVTNGLFWKGAGLTTLFTGLGYAYTNLFHDSLYQLLIGLLF